MSGKAKNKDRITCSHAELESYFSHEPVAKETTAGPPSRVRIKVYHYRNRLLDYDNLSIKGALDGIVKLGILTDDSPQQIAEVRHKQVKSEEEKTVIILEEI